MRDCDYWWGGGWYIAEYFKWFVMRVVATDEYGGHILQGLLHVDMNEKSRMKILMTMLLMVSTMTTMTTIMIIWRGWLWRSVLCVGSKTGRRGWVGVVLCWTSEWTRVDQVDLLQRQRPVRQLSALLCSVCCSITIMKTTMLRTAMAVLKVEHNWIVLFYCDNEEEDL